MFVLFSNVIAQPTPMRSELKMVRSQVPGLGGFEEEEDADFTGSEGEDDFDGAGAAEEKYHHSDSITPNGTRVKGGKTQH